MIDTFATMFVDFFLFLWLFTFVCSSYVVQIVYPILHSLTLVSDTVLCSHFGLFPAKCFETYVTLCFFFTSCSLKATMVRTGPDNSVRLGVRTKVCLCGFVPFNFSVSFSRPFVTCFLAKSGGGKPVEKYVFGAHFWCDTGCVA